MGVPSSEHIIDMTWTAAVDKGKELSGLDDYGYIFNNTATETCTKTKNLEETATSVSSGVLADGDWWFHICPVDNAGNNTVAVGPFTLVTAVGGDLEPIDPAALPLETLDSSGPGAGVLAGVVVAVAAVAITLSGAAWYARRRWLR